MSVSKDKASGLWYYVYKVRNPLTNKVSWKKKRGFATKRDALHAEADIPAYEDFLTSITNWKEEYLNSFRRPYDDRKQSNALSEYMNSRLRVLINVSNGLSNFPRFRARALYALNRKLYYTITNHLQSNKRIGKKRGSYKK